MIKPSGAKALGFLFEESAGGMVRERDTYSCQHCNSVRSKTPGAAGHLRLSWCKQCMGLVCPVCRTMTCDPVEKKMARVEAGGSFYLEEDPRF